MDKKNRKRIYINGEIFRVLHIQSAILETTMQAFAEQAIVEKLERDFNMTFENMRDNLKNTNDVGGSDSV